MYRALRWDELTMPRWPTTLGQAWRPSRPRGPWIPTPENRPGRRIRVGAPPYNVLNMLTSQSIEANGWFGPHGRSRPHDAGANERPGATLDERLFTQLDGDERLGPDPP